jgi:hypothetical protein
MPNPDLHAVTGLTWRPTRTNRVRPAGAARATMVVAQVLDPGLVTHPEGCGTEGAVP